jgi:hypothetical protein
MPASLIHLYEFKNNLNDTLGGPPLQLYGSGGTLSGNSYIFPSNQGLMLQNGLAHDDSYTIIIDFKFTS